MTHFKFPAHLFLLWSLCRVRTRSHKRWPAKSSFFQVVWWKAAPQALQAWRHSLEQVLNSEASEATKEQVPPSPTQLEQCLSVNGGHRHHSISRKIYSHSLTLFLNVARGWRPVTSSVSLPPSQKHWKATHFLEVIFFSWKQEKKWFYQVNFKVSQRKSR